jgi:hypothetical protein
MTHASNISIPARFVFRPFRVEWEVAQAIVVAWGQPKYPTLVFQGSPEKVAPRPNSDAVLASIALRRTDGESVSTLGNNSGLYGPVGEYDFFEVEINRTDLPPDCLQPHETPETVPDIAGRDFEILACRLPRVDGLGASLQPVESLMDAWAMREEFFALKDEVYDTLLFLNRWGLWKLQWLLKPETLWPLPFVIVSPYRLWSQRDAFMKAAAGSSRAWLSTATPLQLEQVEKRPYFMIERSYCEDAIKATLTIDHLANVKFGICKRHDCRKLFKRTTAQKRLYCTPHCAHLANVRKLRKLKAKSIGKGTKNNATRKNERS